MMTMIKPNVNSSTNSCLNGAAAQSVEGSDRDVPEVSQAHHRHAAVIPVPDDQVENRHPANLGPDDCRAAEAAANPLTG
jgi:hypothetical protein